MNRTAKIAMGAMIILINIPVVFSSCTKENKKEPLVGINDPAVYNNKTDTINCACVINPSDTITQEEIDMLLYMREEEKLARDVYSAMADLYFPPIFKNISKSEQHHMNQVLCLLQYYNIPDPASAETGVFNNSELQELYNNLVEQGSVSLASALTAGATIEDKDIYDLEHDMTLTDNPAILTIFSKLSCASGNHIRSFKAHLDFHGVTYSPQFISQEEYDGIISLPHQYCGAAGVSNVTENQSVY